MPVLAPVIISLGLAISGALAIIGISVLWNHLIHAPPIENSIHAIWAWANENIILPIRQHLFGVSQTIYSETSQIHSLIKSVQSMVLEEGRQITNAVYQTTVFVWERVIPRLSELEQWRYSAANWLHSYLQPIAEGAKALSETVRDWVNNYAVPTFEKIESTVAWINAYIAATVRNLYDSIISAQVQAEAKANEVDARAIERDANIASEARQSASLLSEKITSVESATQAGFQNIETIIADQRNELLRSITQMREYVDAETKEAADAMEREYRREDEEPEDWLLLAFMAFTRQQIIENQDGLISFFTSAFTPLKGS